MTRQATIFFIANEMIQWGIVVKCRQSKINDIDLSFVD
jgi:hypothetical protein